MENKTIRIFDKECTSCSNCYLCQFAYDDYADQHIICGYSGQSVFNSHELRQIDPICPFLKPLTKEAIESCGFKFDRNIDSVIKFSLFKESNSLYFLVKYDNGVILIGEDGGMCQSQNILFKGSINNLPEFKLLLKMLNIE